MPPRITPAPDGDFECTFCAHVTGVTKQLQERLTVPHDIQTLIRTPDAGRPARPQDPDR